MPVLVFLVLLYACYWVVRAILTAVVPHRQVSAPRAMLAEQPPPLSGAATEPGARFRAASPPNPPGWPAPPSRGGTWPHGGLHPHDPDRDVLVLGPPRARLAQWVGSLVGSALVTLTVCLVMVVLNGFRAAAEPQLWAIAWWTQYAWLVTVSLAGAWAVLTASKFWEGRPGDAMTRRFLLMVVGLGLGLVAFWATRWYTVELTHDKHFMQLLSFQAHRTLSPADGWPEAKYYLASFGMLLLVARWWRQADPVRGARMGLWPIVACVVLAALVADIWGFPQPWLPMIACCMSVAVQLASPWVHPRDRRWRSPSA
jgi:hypothetical protein